MLVLSRKQQEALVIGGGDGSHQPFKITVLGVCGGRVQLGFEADSSISIRRMEVHKRRLAQPEKDTTQNNSPPPTV